MRGQLTYLAVLVGLAAALVWISSWAPDAATFHVEPRLEKLTPDGVTILWESPDEQLGKVEYGPTDKLGSTVAESAPGREHSVRLEGLAPATRYFYRVSGGDLPSRIRSFTTRTAPPSFHVEPYLQLPAPDAMTIMWETTEKLPGRVEFGPTEQLGSVVHEKAPARLHQVRLTGLKVGEKYHYRVVSGPVSSAIKTFKAPPPLGTGKWRMALYGDSRSNPALHRKVVDQIAKHDVDLILHTGDIVANGKNYASWRTEFFTPLAPIAAGKPWVSTIGNHEADAENYFSYVALPGNERFYSFEFANAHIVCLDSNGWIAKGRDSKQYQWMAEHLKQPRSAKWTFVVFHHPLFSGHKTRPINPLRWDWAPLFLDPASGVDGVLNGHDHFYARCHLLGRLRPEPFQATLFLTSAGGGAPLYPIRERDYLASIRAVHHFTLFDFDGDQVTITPIDIQGNVFDRYVLKKESTPPDELISYEVEELKEFLRKALAAAPTTPIAGANPTTIDAFLEVPTRFDVPISGRLHWQPADGWYFRATETPFNLEPKGLLKIPLQAVVEQKGLGTTPKLTIEFAPGKFRNRTIELFPFKLTGPSVVSAAPARKVSIDGVLDDNAWQKAEPLFLLPTTPGAEGRPGDQVKLASDGETLFVAASLADAANQVSVVPPSETQEPSRLVLSSEHVRVELSDGKETWVYALSAENIPYHSAGGLQSNRPWQARAAAGKEAWLAEMAVPLKPIGDPSKLKINVVHRVGATGREYELRPTFEMGSSPDVIPDWKSGTKPDRFAELRLP
jgi:hypothetical protein